MMDGWVGDGESAEADKEMHGSRAMRGETRITLTRSILSLLLPEKRMSEKSLLYACARPGPAAWRIEGS